MSKDDTSMQLSNDQTQIQSEPYIGQPVQGYPPPGYPMQSYPQPAYPQPAYPQQAPPMQYNPAYPFPNQSQPGFAQANALAGNYVVVQSVQLPPPVPYNESPDEKDPGIEEQWQIVYIPVQRRRGMTYIQEYKIQLPQNDAYNLHAATDYMHLPGINKEATCCRFGPKQTLPLRQIDFTLQQIDPGHRILMVCSEQELKNYVDNCSNAVRDQWNAISNLRSLYCCLAILLVFLSVSIIIIPILIDPMNVQAIFITMPLFLLCFFGFQIALYQILRVFMAKKIVKVGVILQEHVQRTRGDLMRKGIKPRAGPYATYIKFETRQQFDQL